MIENGTLLFGRAVFLFMLKLGAENFYILLQSLLTTGRKEYKLTFFMSRIQIVKKSLDKYEELRYN